MTEALKLAFADRHRYYGDPKFVNVPMDQLLSEAYATERCKYVDPRKAAPGMPEAGETDITAAPKQKLPRAATGEPVPQPDTSYVCVIDRYGNAFSATPSDGSSATPVIPGTGLCPSRGSQSWCCPKYPASVAPGKRPRLTCSPAMALRNGKVFMPFGSPGMVPSGAFCLRVHSPTGIRTPVTVVKGRCHWRSERNNPQRLVHSVTGAPPVPVTLSFL